MGIARLKEALESNDWNAIDDDEIDAFEGLLDEDDDFGEDDDGSLGFGIDPKELEEEMRGMKEAIYGGTLPGDEGKKEEDGEENLDKEVEKLQAMMMKMQAVRGMYEFCV